MTEGRTRRKWAAAAAMFVVLLASILGPSPASATETSAAVPAAVAQPAVSNNPIELAQTLANAQSNGTFRTNPTTIFTREIAPLASGQALAGCALDVRILQVLVLSLQNFGSLSVSDLQRPCIGSNLNCGPPTYSVHCLNPGEAIDFTSIGGRGLNGSNDATFALLRFLDTFVPGNTNAGQANCRSGLVLSNINQFSDSCNHQHVDFRNTNAPLNVAIAQGALPSLADSRAYVQALYQDYLGRSATTDEQQSWGGQLAIGSPRGIVSDGFVNSDEYRLIRIDAAYRSILGRDAEGPGRQNWLDAMHSGRITTDDISKQLYGSQEFYFQHTGTDQGFAAALYTILLQRSATAGEKVYWADLIAQNGRDWVIDQFWNQPETIGKRVSAMYTLYLGRTPDPPGLASWVDAGLRLGDSGLRSGFTSSSEYYERSLRRFG